MRRVVLACSADDKYAMPAAVMLYSALSHLDAGTQAAVYIMDAGVSEVSKRKIERVTDIDGLDRSICWIEPDLPGFHDVLMSVRLPLASYFRLALADVLPAHLDRVLYLDGDCIVEADLLELWRHAMDGRPLWAVPDYAVQHAASPNGAMHALYRAAGLAPDTPYFNSGVLLINLERWRAEKVGAAALDFLRTHAGTVEMSDQDGLNAAVGPNWGQLDPRWNVPPLMMLGTSGWPDSALTREVRANRDRLLRNAFILHFACDPKPWHVGKRRTACLRWIYYLRQSGWFEPGEFRQWYLRWAVRSAVAGANRFYRYRLRRTGHMFDWRT